MKHPRTAGEHAAHWIQTFCLGGPLSKWERQALRLMFDERHEAEIRGRFAAKVYLLKLLGSPPPLYDFSEIDIRIDIFTVRSMIGPHIRNMLHIRGGRVAVRADLGHPFMERRA